MPTATAGKLCEVMGGNWINGERNSEIYGIISKYKKVKPGYFYFDVKGDRRGNSTIFEAVKNGATGVVISKDKEPPPIGNPKVIVTAQLFDKRSIIPEQTVFLPVQI